MKKYEMTYPQMTYLIQRVKSKTYRRQCAKLQLLHNGKEGSLALKWNDDYNKLKTDDCTWMIQMRTTISMRLTSSVQSSKNLRMLKNAEFSLTTE